LKVTKLPEDEFFEVRYLLSALEIITANNTDYSIDGCYLKELSLYTEFAIQDVDNHQTHPFAVRIAHALLNNLCESYQRETGFRKPKVYAEQGQ